ncbi:MAG TPA: EamA family transporter [Puia sp.]|jgi:transporter family protein|nr:EamA family transporter [Puia sp.]
MFTISPWVYFALLSALFAALTAIFAKAGLKNIDSDLATAIRTAIILLITWSIVFLKKSTNELPSLSKSNWIFLILSAIATGLSWLFYYRALQLGKASEVSIIDKGSLLLVVLLSFLFLKEPITPKLLLAAGLVFAGMLVVIWK